MALSAAKSCLNFSKFLICNKTLFTRSVDKFIFAAPRNTRSLFSLSRNQNVFPLTTVSPKTLQLSKCSCCYMHTKGDEELSAFLADEIQNEIKSIKSESLPKLEGFDYKLSGSEVELVKKLNGETITIKANVNNSVDAEDTTMDPNRTTEQPEAEMKSKPEFRIEITKGKKTFSFLCTYSNELPEEDSETYSDAFQISEIALYEGETDDATYVVSGDIMDGYLYDLLMNYLEERGISNAFADDMVAFFTSYEHQLYVKLLQRIKSFVDK